MVGSLSGSPPAKLVISQSLDLELKLDKVVACLKQGIAFALKY